MKTAFAQAVRLSRVWPQQGQRSLRSKLGVHLPKRLVAERTIEDWARLGGGLAETCPATRTIKRDGLFDQ